MFLGFRFLDTNNIGALRIHPTEKTFASSGTDSVGIECDHAKHESVFPAASTRSRNALFAEGGRMRPRPPVLFRVQVVFHAVAVDVCFGDDGFAGAVVFCEIALAFEVLHAVPNRELADVIRILRHES